MTLMPHEAKIDKCIRKKKFSSGSTGTSSGTNVTGDELIECSQKASGKRGFLRFFFIYLF